jgi:hypothetical protein
MTVTLHTFVDLYDRVLGSLSHILDKGEAYAKEHDIAPDEMLDWRLVGDMAPLRFQIMVVVNFTRSWTARVAGQPVPEGVEDTLDLAGFRAAIAESRAHLAALSPEHFAGRDDAPITFKIADVMEPTLPAGQWLSVFATTNIYFHLSIAYAILRMKGVPIGKADLFAGRL